jgi:2,5-diamino-6-(ribosylamino)-4(3H)-pyrimidinone 5'-phosphate reductase
MKKPRLIVHNSVSTDLCVTGFDVDMMMHYSVAGSFNADAHLVGSVTARTGVSEFSDEKRETEPDFKKPEGKQDKPYFVLIDTEGKMWMLLHLIRSSEYFRDAIVLISDKTSKDYVTYLEKRNYDYIKTGKDKVDLKKALQELGKKYRIKTIMTGTGPTLSSLLFDKGLVDELSLIIVPEVIGKNPRLFQGVKKKVKLELKKNKKLGNSVHLYYKVK